jgi:DNA repair protein RecO (recombination protein O)
MLHKTKGIVLGFIRYRDTSIIVRVYTEVFGLRSYLVNGVRSTKNKSSKIALFQPFTLLDLVVYNKPNTDLNYISETKIYQPFHTIPFNVHKVAICLFLSEILTKVLRNEQDTNEEIFEFLLNSILVLENIDQHFENFHLQFMIRMSVLLGFFTNEADEIGKQLQQAGYLFDYEKYSAELNLLIQSDYGTPIPMNHQARNEVLDALVKFYQLHSEGLGEIKSLNVLREIY